MTTNLRPSVGGAVSYIGTAKDTMEGMIKDPVGVLLGNKAAAIGINDGYRETGPGSIPQIERAFTVRPRSTPMDNDNSYTSERGPFASIKLLTNQTSSEVVSAVTSGNTPQIGQGIDSVATALTSEGGYTDFLLTNIDVSFNEKLQVNEVFGDSEVVYYFGRSPVQFNLSGILFDDVDNNWFYRFMVSYWSILRGTQMAKNHHLCQINLPNMTLTGTICGMNYSQDATRDTDIRFNMQFIAKSIVPRPVLLPSEILNNNALKLDLSNLPGKFTDMAMINNIKNTVDQAKSYLGSTVGKVGSFLGDVGSTIEDAALGVNAAIGGAIGAAREFFESSTGGFLSVASLRANLIAPVYGVLTTLTKVVKSITGQVLSLFNGGSSLLGGIIRDVKSIANEAISLVNAIEGGINSIVKLFEGGANDLRRAISSIKNAAGAISRSPENISNIFKRLSKGGYKKGQISAMKSGRNNKARLALLNSGNVYKSSTGATLSG